MKNRIWLLAVGLLMLSCTKTDLPKPEIDSEVTDLKWIKLPPKPDTIKNRVTVTYTGDTTMFPHTKHEKFESYRTKDNVIYDGTRSTTYYVDKDTGAISSKYSESIHKYGFKIGFIYPIKNKDSAINWKTLLECKSTRTIVNRAGNYETLKDSTYKRVRDDKGNISESYRMFFIEDIAEGLVRKTGMARGRDVMDENGTSVQYVWESKVLEEEPIIKNAEHDFASEGQVRFKVYHNGINEIQILDYGSGADDNKATLTINGVTEEIYLPRYFVGAY